MKLECFQATTWFCKIYQTDVKLSAKERDAARQTHASPSCNLNGKNGDPNDAEQRKNGQKMARHLQL